jgi:hypothetical protein
VQGKWPITSGNIVPVHAVMSCGWRCRFIYSQPVHCALAALPTGKRSRYNWPASYGSKNRHILSPHAALADSLCIWKSLCLPRGGNWIFLCCLEKNTATKVEILVKSYWYQIMSIITHFPAHTHTHTFLVCSQSWENDYSSVMSVCLSIRPSTCLSAWKNSTSAVRIFMEFDVYGVCKNQARKIQVLLQYYKNNGHFAWRPIYVYSHISLGY